MKKFQAKKSIKEVNYNEGTKQGIQSSMIKKDVSFNQLATQSHYHNTNILSFQPIFYSNLFSENPNLVLSFNGKNKIQSNFAFIASLSKILHSFVNFILSDSNEEPIKIVNPYSEINSLIMNEIRVTKKVITLKNSKTTQITKFTTIKRRQYIMKRSVLYYLMDQDSLILRQNYNKFIQAKYNEYALLKSLSASYAFSRPISFYIILNKNLNFIATEILIEGIWKHLVKSKELSFEVILYIFIQLGKSLQFVEEFRLTSHYLVTSNVWIINF